MRATSTVSLGALLGTASASFTFAIASLYFDDFMSACASWSGLPTSGRTASGLSAAKAVAPNMRAAHRTACRPMRFIGGLPSIEELLGSYEADLRDPQALRRRH